VLSERRHRRRVHGWEHRWPHRRQAQAREPFSARCVQIEIVGFAAQTPTWAPEKLAFIRDVVRGIEDLVPIPHRPIAASLDASGVGATPANRMSVREWNRFSGWCGHQHVPSETHWDPGAIDIAAILS
jgi:hypothetical protein